MNDTQKRRVEFGDWQTPPTLAEVICDKLVALGVRPSAVIEPTCGVGAFVLAALSSFPSATIHGFEVNSSYLDELRAHLPETSRGGMVRLHHADFFATDWAAQVREIKGNLLVLGNFPWVTSSAQGAIGGANLPAKSNFQGRNGFDAISGKANFDISEWMLLEVLRWFTGRSGAIAMLVKSAVARKVLAQAGGLGAKVTAAHLFRIDAKRHFGAAVDACLLVVEIGEQTPISDEYFVYETFDSVEHKRVGHRGSRTIGDLDAFDQLSHLIGEPPQKWRSGAKHDASSIMEFTRTAAGFENGLSEVVALEDAYLFPLLKGSDVAGAKPWREKFVLVTQRFVGEATANIEHTAPQTWAYLAAHAAQLDARGSTIYAKGPRFAMFGVGDYAFRPWKVAICALYKRLDFRLVGPLEGKPVIFDDTVYFVSFETRAEAERVLEALNSSDAKRLLSSMIFWDEKRPIKTSVLNSFDWTRTDLYGLGSPERAAVTI